MATQKIYQTLAIGLATLEKDSNGKTTYTLELVNSTFTPSKKNIGLLNIFTFVGGLGPFKLEISFDSDTYDVSGNILLFGYSILGVSINAKSVDILKYDIGIAKGDLFFYIVNDNELWVHLKCDPLVGRTYNKDSKLLMF